MSSKAVFAVAVVVMLAGVGPLAARKTNDVAGIEALPISQRPPIPDSREEKQILDVLDAMRHGPHTGLLSVPLEDGRVLRVLTEAVGAKRVVELGTSNGYASLWFCLALRTTGGRLTTFEIDPRRAALARENFKRAGVDKLVTLIEGDAHEKVTQLKGLIDIVYIDADKNGYLDYLHKLLPLVRPGGLILAHDTTDVASQMQDYLDAVTTDPKLETIFLHQQGSGIGVTLKKRRGQ